MILFHAGVHKGQVLLWGEAAAQSSEEQDQPIKRRRGRTASKSGSQPYPYDAGAERLSAALLEAGIDFTLDKEQTRTMTAWLPTVGNQPIASSSLIAEPPPASTGKTAAKTTAKTALAPWQVTVLCLSIDQAVEFLCTCAGKQTLAPGVVIGHDLAFWTAAMRMAGTLVARQQFLPGLTREDEIYRALWKPVLTGAESEVLTRMAKAMPGVGRALTDSESSSPPEIPSISVLSGFINQVVDYLVRFSDLSQLPDFPQSGLD